MADDIPIQGMDRPQQPNLMQRINQDLNSFFGPINRAAESVMGPQNQQWKKQLPFALGAMRPGMGSFPVTARAPVIGTPRNVFMSAPERGIVNQPAQSYSTSDVASAVRGMPDYPMPAQRPIMNQPAKPPTESQLMYQMLSRRANRMGVTQDMRNNIAHNPNMRAQSFNPEIERQLIPGDALFGTQVMTPANRTPNQSYNLALIKQLLGQ